MPSEHKPKPVVQMTPRELIDAVERMLTNDDLSEVLAAAGALTLIWTGGAVMQPLTKTRRMRSLKRSPRKPATSAQQRRQFERRRRVLTDRDLPSQKA